MTHDDILAEIDSGDDLILTPYDILFGGSVVALVVLILGPIFAVYAFLWS